MSEEKPKKKRGRPKGSKNKPTKPKAEAKVEELQFETKLSEAKVEEPQFETKLGETKPEKQTEKESKNSDEMIAWCGACRFEIIGNSNWIRHIESKEHLSNVEKFSKPIPKDTNQIKQSIQKKSPNNGLIAGLIVAVGVAMFLVGVMMPDSQNLEDYVTKSDLEDSISRLEEKLDNIQQSAPVRQPTQPSTSPIIQISPDDDPIKGNPDAPVTVIEFSDFQCPFCLRFYDQTFPLIEKNYIDTGKVKYVYRDFPLTNLHPNVTIVHIAAECADEQGKFWEYHDMLFAKQADWKNLTPENLKSELKMYATTLGLSGGIFESCLSSQEIKAEVATDFLHAGIAGATGTPTFFIGNEKDGFIKLVGALSYSSFQDAIDSQLGVAKETLSERIPWSETPSTILIDEIEVPVAVYLVEDPTGEFTTTRSEESLNSMFKEVNRIWEPAKINFVIEKIQRVTMENDAIQLMIERGINKVSGSDDDLIKLFFVSELKGEDGASFPTIKIILVEDVPRVHDYITVAHEFGHVLGLHHVYPDDRLMSIGKIYGEQLTEREIKIARQR